nr:VWA domain-containing protein [Actinorugispora endophytica]
MDDKSKSIDSLRVRAVVYRDYYFDDLSKAMEASEFFSLPQQASDFSRFVDGITATGGGDEPENGLEALAVAMRSNWAVDSDKRRQIIVVWTDASVHPLERKAGSKPEGYPEDLPADFDALTDMWEGQEHMDPNAKRLIVYAPDALGWTEIANHWENVIHFPSQGGKGLEEVDYSTILDTIANSI